MRLAVRHHPSKQPFIRPAGEHCPLKRFGVDAEKLDEVLVEPDRHVVVVLNLPGIAEPDLVDKPPQMGNATEQRFRAAGIGWLGHRSDLQLTAVTALQPLSRTASQTSLT